jgi:cytochrome P450
MIVEPGTDLGAVDLTDLELFTTGDVHGTFARLRRERPVHWNRSADGHCFWALTRYQDVADAYADSKRLSSRYGTLLGGSYRQEHDSAGGHMLVASDSPEHRQLRQQIHRAFTPRMIERAAVTVRSYVRAAVDRLLADGGGDFARTALELPAGLLAMMYGYGREDAFRLLELTRMMIGFRDPRYRGSNDETTTLLRAQVELLDMLHDLALRRRSHPADDLASFLLAGTVNGRPMTDDEVLYNCLNVAVGGNETTPLTATGAIEAFIEHPDQLDRLYADRGLLVPALNEILRWTSTSAFVQRTALVDLVIGGQRIRAGESVTLWNISANRDEQALPGADRFDIGRDPNRQLAFGVGQHRCIGMSAAMMELSILFEELAERQVRFELAGPVTRLRSNFIVGPTSLPVLVRAGR